MQEEILQRMWNLLTLLDIKKQLGDLVDITDRLFGYLLYHEEGNAPFVFSTLAVIFALSEELEARIEDSQWSSKDWEAEGYPHMDSEYIYSVYVPFECSKEEMEAAFALIPGEMMEGDIHFFIDKNYFIAYIDEEYYPISEFYEILIDICIQLRLNLERRKANAQSPN